MTAAGWRATIMALAVTIAGVDAAACSGTPRATPERIVVGGDANRGAKAMVYYGCGSCHTIPGVHGARALVGPPLEKFGKRSYIAGELSNTPDNLVRWITDPRGVEPGTDMPNLGVTVAEARDIAAYLERLG